MRYIYIFSILAFILIAVFFFFINNDGRIVSIFVIDDYGYNENLAEDIEKQIGFHDYDYFGSIISNNINSTWYAATTNKGERVNVFAEFTITLLSRSLDRLVIETSNNPRNQSDVQNLIQGSGSYQVILGEGYEWTQKVVSGP